MGSVAQLWRHPIKSHSREALDAVTLAAGHTMPWDRVWAVAHEASKFDATNPAWVACQNFMLGTRTPALAGLWAQLDEETATVTLTHADIGTLTFAPDDPADVARFLAWIAPLCPADRAQPAALVKVPGRGMTDTDFPSVSIMTLASHDAVASKLGHDLELERWRGNIWIDGVPAWDELDWIGKVIRIGDTEIAIREPIKRCLHTAANPQTGKRDVDTLGALTNGWGHQDFGVYGEVTKGGNIRIGDPMEVL